MTGTRLTGTALRWPAAGAVLMTVLAVAGSAPAQAQPSDDVASPAHAQPYDDAALFARCLKVAQEATFRSREMTAADVFPEAPTSDTVSEAPIVDIFSEAPTSDTDSAATTFDIRDEAPTLDTVSEAPTAVLSSETTKISVAVVCERPDGTPVDPKLWLPAAPTLPAPIPAATEGHPACVTGPRRPVVDTALTSVSATAAQGEALSYEYGSLGRSATVITSTEVLEFVPGDLAPGKSYRWRARVDDLTEQANQPLYYTSPDDEQGWSPWCEFTVSAEAIDYRKLGDVDLEQLNELGLRPDRKYPVSLSGRQQRLLRAGTDVTHARANMRLTGPRWTELIVQLFDSAYLAEETALENGEDDRTPPESAAYRELAGAISVKLGGPRHPKLGYSDDNE